MPSEESYAKIEGVWKESFRFRRIVPADHAAVFDHISSTFLRDEPTCNLLGWDQVFADDFNRVVELFLKDDMSFLLEHIPTGKIAGVRVTFHHKPGMSFDEVPLNSKKTQVLLKYVTELEERADVAKRHNIDSWAEFFVASTSPEFRKLGIAGEFYDRSIQFLIADGFKNALVAVTSPYTKQATKKRGFVQQSRMDYDELLDFEGNPVFKKEDLTPDHFGLIMLKNL